MAAKIECARCDRKFGIPEVNAGLIELETMICGYCYAEMQSMPHQICCFGKPTEIKPNGKKLLGYNPKAPECKRYCPDRHVCARIVKGSNG